MTPLGPSNPSRRQPCHAGAAQESAIACKESGPKCRCEKGREEAGTDRQGASKEDRQTGRRQDGQGTASASATPTVKTGVKPVAKPKAAPVKQKKPKLVRDSFTIPKAEYSALADLKQRAGKLASPAKKSELLRAGIKALATMGDNPFLAALKAVPAIKTGRPNKV